MDDMGRTIGLVVVVGIGGVIVAGMLMGGTGGPPECETPVLAAGVPAAGLPLASCVETVSYDGEIYFVDCVRVHPSRIGESFLTDGGDTYFDGAREIEGIAREAAFLLEGASCRQGEGLAASGSFTRLQAGLLTVPLDADDAIEKARRRRPWIVPGKRQVPEALKVEAVLEEGLIRITNLNRFTWRDCDQLQIGSDDEWAPWETRPAEQVRAGESVSYQASDFSRDSSGIEELSSEAAEELRGAELILMCDAPKGRAAGATALR